jgi:hypothetical protein
MQVRCTGWSHACSFQMAYGLKPLAYRELIQIGQRQVDERANPALQEPKGPDEGFRSVHVRALDGCRVLDAPVGD